MNLTEIASMWLASPDGVRARRKYDESLAKGYADAVAAIQKSQADLAERLPGLHDVFATKVGEVNDLKVRLERATREAAIARQAIDSASTAAAIAERPHWTAIRAAAGAKVAAFLAELDQLFAKANDAIEKTVEATDSIYLRSMKRVLRVAHTRPSVLSRKKSVQAARQAALALLESTPATNVDEAIAAIRATITGVHATTFQA